MQQIRQQLNDIRRGVHVEENVHNLMRLVVVHKDRHLQARLLLARAQTPASIERGALIAAAADILLAFLKKQASAYMLYQYAAQSDTLAQAVNLAPPTEPIEELSLQAQLLELRAKERFEDMVTLLRKTTAREWQLELGAVLRFDCHRALEAADVYEAMTNRNSNDREAWAEFLECLEFLEDENRLRIAVERRILLSQGLEKRELLRQYGWLLNTGMESSDGI